jgi:hypothetical protein
MRIKSLFVIIFNNLNRVLFKVNWKNLRILSPISNVFGVDRGKPIDRYFIENFLDDRKDLIKGVVLEIGDNKYTKMFGFKVTKSEVLTYNIDDSRKNVIIGDLTKYDNLQNDKYDCIILTQTLNFIYDYKKAILGVYHLLKEGGSVLVTSSGISQISEYDNERWGDFWRFTEIGLMKSFEEVFPKENIIIKSYGNVLSSISYLHGISSEELTEKELGYNDPNYPLLITLIAKK